MIGLDDLGGSVRRAAHRTSRHYRLRSTLAHLRQLVGGGRGGAVDDHRCYVMFWQAVHVLDPLAFGPTREVPRPPLIAH